LSVEINFFHRVESEEWRVERKLNTGFIIEWRVERKLVLR
jgi:hypothetical protein